MTESGRIQTAGEGLFKRGARGDPSQSIPACRQGACDLKVDDDVQTFQCGDDRDPQAISSVLRTGNGLRMRSGGVTG